MREKVYVCVRGKNKSAMNLNFEFERLVFAHLGGISDRLPSQDLPVLNGVGVILGPESEISRHFRGPQSRPPDHHIGVPKDVGEQAGAERRPEWNVRLGRFEPFRETS